jgi:hypothetical protein
MDSLATPAAASKPKTPASGAPLYIVHHLHKTAGTTLQNNFALNFRPGAFVPLSRHLFGFQADWVGAQDRLLIDAYVQERAGAKCLFGHLAYGGIEALLPQREARTIIFLRRPTPRVLSLYSFFKHVLPADHLRRKEIEENNWDLAAWLAQCNYLGIDNGQVRGLLWGQDPTVIEGVPLDQGHLQRAKEHLARAWFIGLTESFEDDFLTLAGLLDFSRFDATAHANVSPREQKPDAPLLRQIEERNQLDEELYAFACELHREQTGRPAWAQWARQARRSRAVDQARRRVLAPGGRLYRGVKRRLVKQETAAS